VRRACYSRSRAVRRSGLVRSKPYPSEGLRAGGQAHKEDKVYWIALEQLHADEAGLMKLGQASVHPCSLSAPLWGSPVDT
jgi:hypothetical protein